MLADTPSAGLLFGVPVAVLVVIVCLALAAVVWVKTLPHERKGGYGNYRYDGLGGVILGAFGVAIVTVLLTALLMWPWKYDYHHWVDVQGTVQKVSSRLVSAGDKGGSNQRFVVVLNGKAYGVDDTRASLLKVGDPVKLRCKKEYEWGSSLSANGWACKWNGGVPTV